MAARSLTRSRSVPYAAGTPGPAKARVNVVTWATGGVRAQRGGQVHQQRRQAASVARAGALQPGVEVARHVDLDDAQPRAPVRRGIEEDGVLGLGPAIERQLGQHRAEAAL